MSENNKPVLSEQEKKRRDILAVAIIICSIAIFVLVILRFANVISFNAYTPMIGIVLLLQSCILWRTNRKTAVFLLCVAVFSVIAFLFEIGVHFFVK